MALLTKVILAACVLLLCAGQALADKRVALIVANAHYQTDALQNPLVDADIVAPALRLSLIHI